MFAISGRLLTAKILILCWALLPHFAAQSKAFEDTMAQRLQACTACHGDQGRAGPDGYYPRLAGKPAAYLYQQLVNFRDGNRHYAPMGGLLEPLGDAYLREIAEHFASLSLPYPAPAEKQVTAADFAKGKKLVTDGDPARQLPACTQCHGTALTGVLPNVPGLLGLPQDYLNAQLGAWRTGQRKAHAPDCMGQVADKLTRSDIYSVTSWLSTQPVPANSNPALRAPAWPAGLKELSCARPSVAQTIPKAPASAEIERGAYLARIGNCAHCHTAKGGTPFAGGRAIDTPFGAVYSSNITSDSKHGLGQWNAQDFWQAMHHGQSRDGRALNPAFPYTSYTLVSREDSDALWAYLRTVAPSDRANTPHAMRWPFGTQAAIGIWRTLYFKPGDAPKDRGAYLVRGLGHCLECHAQRNALGGITSQGLASGGVLPKNPWYAPSLRRDGEGSVAHWAELDVVNFLKNGISRQGSASGPMAEVVLHGTQHLSAADATAMARYMQGTQGAATPAASVPPPPAAPASVKAMGMAVYEKHCAQCHGKQGQGEPGAYPALAKNRAVNLSNSNNLVLTVLRGGFAPSTAGNPRHFGMPPFSLALTDAEVAAVLTYVRGAWGNTAGPVAEFDINKLRSSIRQ